MEGPPSLKWTYIALEAKRLLQSGRSIEICLKGMNPHFKGAYTANGRVVVANNSYHEQEHLGARDAGRTAGGMGWEGMDDPGAETISWRFTGKALVENEYGNPIFALGWDKASVILKLFADGPNGRPTGFPKAVIHSTTPGNTEWFRIREAQTERFLMDAHGIYYELPAQVYEDKTWGIIPISNHLRITPDFCHWRGLFVMACNQTDLAVGQPQSGLWFGNVEDLWQFGKT